MNLFELKKARVSAYDKMDQIVALAENAKREPTPEETREINQCMTTVRALDPQISALEAKNTLHTVFKRLGGVALLGGQERNGAIQSLSLKAPRVTLSTEYPEAFFAYIASGGKEVSAALYEGAGSSGGYVVPVVVDDQIVPLAPQEMAVRRLAQVIPTTSDIKVPTQASFATAALKTESGATVYSFPESDPTLGQFTLSAFMAGVVNSLSWELTQDVPAFQSFAVQDQILAMQMLEENLYVNGTGTGQAQGLIGNVGSGITVDPDSNGNVVSINGTLDLIGTLNAVYHPNATWLMSRATSIVIRKAQTESNLFVPAWTRVGSQDFLHGFPVEYSNYMPTPTRGNCPILFGDFKRGYIIGDRGGAGINVKVLDQPLATQGQLQLLTYRRTDGRVRRSEAIQAYNVTASGSSSPA
jgi:HK97 family phage major capsid protein